MKRKTVFSAVVLLFFLFNSQLFGQSKEFEISKNIDIYATLFKQLRLNYVDQINPGELNEKAINAMLESMDPYTVFINESQLEDYKFMTTGQYGGIGALIQQRDDYVIISEPYAGFPADNAGLMAGDRIIAIDGKEMKGKTASQVSELMKGQAGSSFEITVERPIIDKQIVKTIVREEIKIDNVPYYGMLKDDIAYIKLTNFTDNAGGSVAKAFRELKNNNPQGVILDLRNNGGGLLHEAVNIMNIFVDKGELIVKTKGKLSDKNNTYKTTKTPLDVDMPVVVLINGRSASASEIVSGAMQDLDRGVLVGERTFGKGLVQNILPLSYNTKAKVTVAKYYIPSGRCIQEIDYSEGKDDNGEFESVPDSLIKTYTTRNGRKVYDGKGIRPDVAVEPEEASRIALTLFAKNHIFDFATMYKQEHDTIAAAEDFEITEDIYDEFLEFLEGKEFEYTTETEKALEKLESKAKAEKYWQFIELHVEDLKQDLMAHKSNDLMTFQEDIKDFLRGEIVSRYYYQRGAIQSSLQYDKQVARAVEILHNQKTYESILEGTYDEADDKE